MNKLTFGQLPVLVRVSVGLSLINIWVSFEEFVVDRVGLWKYMPYYKVPQFCVWDLTVTLVVAGLFRFDHASTPFFSFSSPSVVGPSGLGRDVGWGSVSYVSR